jgi:hypothetical protein
MLKSIEHFNFGPSILKWIKLFYTDITGCISNNGYLSEPFSIQRGVRQGCPLSPLLFIIAIEILSIKVKNNQDIKGIVINHDEIKQSLFADDATFITDGSEKSFNALIKTIDEFSIFSGLKLNTKKSTVLRTGSLRNTDRIFCKMKKFAWTSVSAKTLGIVFCNDKRIRFDLNFKPKIDELLSCLNRWKRHTLNLFGKITVIKTFALPKIIYPLTVLENPPEHVITELIKHIHSFLWDGKPEKISRITIKREYEDGGIKMVDLRATINSIKASWVKRLMNSDNKGLWKSLYMKIVNNLGGKLIFESNLNVNDVKNKIKHTFLRDVITGWANINYETDPSSIRHFIWNNSLITNKITTFYYKSWSEKGIMFVDQLFCNIKKAFYSFDELKAKYNLSNTEYLKYHTLIANIPNSIKSLLKNGNYCMHNSTLFARIMSIKKPSKLLYNHYLMRHESFTNNKSIDKWNSIFDNLNWVDIYTMSKSCTIDTKLRAFQYKFINRLTPTNTYLYKCRITNSTLCDFCSCEPETLIHLYWECSFAQQFWSSIKSFLNINNIDLELNFRTVSFGCFVETETKNLINYLILIGKYFIHKCKYENCVPQFTYFRRYLIDRKAIEYHIACMKNKIEQHNQKWNFLSLDQ